MKHLEWQFRNNKHIAYDFRDETNSAQYEIKRYKGEWALYDLRSGKSVLFEQLEPDTLESVDTLKGIAEVLHV